MSEKTLAIDAWESLFRAQVTVMRQLTAEFPTDVLSMNEYDVLFNLARCPGRSQRIRDLNRNLLLTQPSVSRLIDRLAARGLVTKRADPGDARGIVVALTDDGFDLFRQVAVAHSASISRIMTNALPPEQLEQLQRITTALRDEVEAA
jgi:DNA-binding MarR family transcriptional regulator